MTKDFFKIHNLKTPKKTENEYYPQISVWLQERGFDFQRIEGLKTVPDYIIWDNEDVIFLEVKYYRGKEKLSELTNYHIFHELTWQDGQLGFRDRCLTKNDKHYVLLIVNRLGEFILV